jgi:hypothetical protein
MLAIVLLYLVCAIYSIIRYVAFAPQNAANIPLFVLNKGIAMAAAFCFAAAFLQQWRRKRGGTCGADPSTWFQAGMFGAVAHIPMSLAILRPGYFKEFFSGDRLSSGGELVFLFGALTAGGIYLLHRTGWSAPTRWWLSLATLSFLFSHVLAMGFCRGLNINRSHAYLPPMWLLSLFGVLAGIGFLLQTRPGAGKSELPGPDSTSCGSEEKPPRSPSATPGN